MRFGGSLSRLTQDENLLEQPETVAEFFANPPGWLTSQLKVYRENPELHFKPLCTAVAAMILGDGGRAPSRWPTRLGASWRISENHCPRRGGE